MIIVDDVGIIFSSKLTPFFLLKNHVTISIVTVDFANTPKQDNHKLNNARIAKI